MSNPAIQIDRLTKFYGTKRGIEGVSFAVEPGEIVGLLGPNGSGKTTIMRLLTTYLLPTSGTVRVMGREATEEPMAVKRMIGYMPENPLLYPEMSVEAYLKFVAELRDVPPETRSQRVQEALNHLNLQDVRRTIIAKLSKGYKQRVGLAGALVHDPQILILDEPTVGLDPKQIIDIRELIKSLGGKKTVILSSHILSEVQQVCQRIVVMNKGRVIAINSRDELLRRAINANKLVVKLMGDFQSIVGKVSALSGVKRVETAEAQPGVVQLTIECDDVSAVQGALSDLALRERWQVHELKLVDVSLEEVFLELTGGGPAHA